MIQLTGQVESLHTQVNGLTVSVEEKQHELGTVYCLMGSKKDLTTAGAVVSTGGVLGIGKTLKPTGHVDESVCIAIDTDQESTVDIPASVAQYRSRHRLPMRRFGADTPIYDRVVGGGAHNT